MDDNDRVSGVVSLSDIFKFLLANEEAMKEAAKDPDTAAKANAWLKTAGAGK